MQEKSHRSNQARTEATLTALKAAARQLFVQHGYAATGTPDIVRAAEVTRGALYHHFADKAALFFAVAQDMANEVAQAIEANSRADDADPLAALLAGADAYLQAMAEGGRAKLLIQEAPAVLTAPQLAALSDLAGVAALQAGLEASLAAALPQPMPPAPLQALTQLLSAAFDRMALALVQREDMGPYQAALRQLLLGVARAPAMP